MSRRNNQAVLKVFGSRPMPKIACLIPVMPTKPPRRRAACAKVPKGQARGRMIFRALGLADRYRRARTWQKTAATRKISPPVPARKAGRKRAAQNQPNGVMPGHCGNILPLSRKEYPLKKAAARGESAGPRSERCSFSAKRIFWRRMPVSSEFQIVRNDLVGREIFLGSFNGPGGLFRKFAGFRGKSGLPAFPAARPFQRNRPFKVKLSPKVRGCIPKIRIFSPTASLMEAFIFLAKGHGKFDGRCPMLYTRDHNGFRPAFRPFFWPLKPAFFRDSRPQVFTPTQNNIPLQRPQRHRFVEH